MGENIMAKQHFNIKKLAEEMKSINGNQNIKQSDMLWYLIKRVDDIDNRLSKVVTIDACKEHRSNSSANRGFIISLLAFAVSAVSALVAWLK